MNSFRIRMLAVAVSIFPCLLMVGCEAEKENPVVSTGQSDDELRNETSEKIKKLENIDPASL